MSSSPRRTTPETEIVTTSGVKVVVRHTSFPEPMEEDEPPSVELAPPVVVRPPPNPHAARDAAVRRIVEKHGFFLLKLLSRVWVNPASAEELQQDVLIVLTAYIDEVGEPGNDRAYLTEVARRLLFNHRRRFRVDVDREADADGSADSAPDPESLLQLVERRVALEEAIDALPAVLQPVARGIDLDGDTVLETAEKLGRPPGTVSTQITRARALVAKILRASERR